MRKPDFARLEEMINILERFLSEVPERCDTMVAAGRCLVDVLEDDPKAYKMSGILQQCDRNIRNQLEAIKEIQSSLRMTDFPVVTPPHYDEW